MKNQFWFFVKILFFIPLFFFFLYFPASAQESEKLLDEANQAYFNGNLDLAQKNYEALLSQGYSSGDLDYNLGNVYFRQSHLGKAIQFYSKALKSHPRDPDVRANLHFAEAKRVNPPPYPFGFQFYRKIIFWNSYITLSEILSLLLVVNTLFWLALSVFLWKKSPFFKRALLTLGALTLLVLVSALLKYGFEEKMTWAVVTSVTAQVRPNFLEQKSVLMTLSEGAVLRVLSSQDLENQESWYQVLLPQGQKGWVKKEDLGLI